MQEPYRAVYPFNIKHLNFIVLLLSVLSTRAVACEWLLRAQPNLVHADRLVFSNSVQSELRRLHLTEAQLKQFAQVSPGVGLSTSRLGFETLLFEPNPAHLDRGYVIEGELRGSRFLVFHVYQATHDDEVEYFKTVAQMQSLAMKEVTLHRSLLKCRSVMIKGWVQAKLWLKHRLSQSALEDLLNRAGPPQLDQSRRTHYPHYSVNSQNAQGRRLRAVLEDLGKCPKGLITAFEIH